jgi:hypothetical protein
MSWISLLVPFIPISLVLFLGWPINGAFIAGIVYLFLSTWAVQERGTRVKLITQSILEGIQGVIPAVALMLGIGMLLIAVVQPPVQQSLRPLLMRVIPSSPLGYVLLFGLAAPLALYRGPLNLWGMGSGLMELIKSVGSLSPFAIMAAFFSTGQIQGVCDPTNTHNVWIANQLKIDVNAILKKTLPYMWGVAVLGLIWGQVKFT